MKPARRRELVDHILATWKVSTRRACGVLRTDRSAYRYRSRRRPQAALVQRIKEIAETRVQYGYRRIDVHLRREGRQVDAERIYRLYKELGLQLRNEVPKRRVTAKLREDRRPAVEANETWAMDFVHDQLATGRKIRILTVVDTLTRFINRFRDAVSAAGLPVGLSAHGLRKAACRRLAEAGCSAPQIMAVSGHKTLAEAQ